MDDAHKDLKKSRTDSISEHSSNKGLEGRRHPVKHLPKLSVKTQHKNLLIMIAGEPRSQIKEEAGSGNKKNHSQNFMRNKLDQDPKEAKNLSHVMSKNFHIILLNQ